MPNLDETRRRFMTHFATIGLGVGFWIVRLNTPQYTDLSDLYIELSGVSEHFAAAVPGQG